MARVLRGLKLKLKRRKHFIFIQTAVVGYGQACRRVYFSNGGHDFVDLFIVAVPGLVKDDHIREADLSPQGTHQLTTGCKEAVVLEKFVAVGQGNFVLD